MHRLSYTVVTALLATAGLVPITTAAPAAAASRPAAVAGNLSERADGRLGAGTDGAALPAAADPDEVRLISVRGAGPFRIGADLARLSAAGLIDWVAPDCDGTVRAGVTGAWAGKILLAFRDGRLVEVGTATAPPRTPAGAGVGMSFAALEEIYGPRGSMIRNDAGDASAYLVRVGSRVELFTGHPIRPGVGYLQVGPASVVERGFREGRSC
ncbi:hypothetical protein F6X68_22700 [Micromonospora sp. AMSO12t]|uniref:hypothetical protein n=1 Tax=unclassified Micromonospora TaxID=2617518 RepID=UPI00124B753B|nr:MULTISPECIES: hypothetical protein [unclassified Micromonospora]KAB1140182.1 hypothetical protein F6X68_22700 [Micromonospora sp. AMSO12t]WSF99594.1 hypothetical protein OG989_17890 [Micromonospora sp. NBC_01740]